MGRSRLSIGASPLAVAAQQFDASAYVPQEIQDDYATGSAYYDQFQQASQIAGGVTFGSGGRITLSPQASDAIGGAIDGAVIASVPVLGEAFAVLLAAGPKAGSGPGVCGTDPPAGAQLSQLQAWPHFVSWQSFYGAYPLGAAGSFEAFANPPLEYNWLLIQNCFGDKAGASPTILAALISSWNALHDSSSTRTITRSGLVPSGWGVPAGYDPIAQALEQALLAKYTPPNQTFEQATSADGGYTGPHGATSSFVVNTGPLKLKPLTLHFGPSSGVQLPTAVSMATAKTAASSGVGGGTLVVAAAAALAGWWFLVAKKPLPKLFR